MRIFAGVSSLSSVSTFPSRLLLYNRCRVRRCTLPCVYTRCQTRLHRTLKGQEVSKGQTSSRVIVRLADRGLSSLIQPSVILAAIESDVQRLVHALRDVLLLVVARQMMEQRMPGGRGMMALQGKIHLGFLRPFSRRQTVAGMVHGTRADSGWRSTSALDPVGRFVARYRVSAKRATMLSRQTNGDINRKT